MMPTDHLILPARGQLVMAFLDFWLSLDYCLLLVSDQSETSYNFQLCHYNENLLHDCTMQINKL